MLVGDSMGRNNREHRANDKNWGMNLTRNIPFKFEVMSEQTCRRFELAQGLEMNKLTLTIKLNANYKIANNDKVEIKGKTYLVVTTSQKYDNNLQSRYKADFNAFTGSTMVGLE